MVVSSSGELAYQWAGDDLILRIRVQARSSIDSIIGINNGHLRIKLTVAPVDGKANQSLIKLLGKSFGVPVSQVCIEKGDTSKSKRVRIRSPKILPEIIKLQ